MKKLIFLFLLTAAAIFATEYDATQTGDSNVAATWGGGGYPVAGDIATIGTSFVVTIPPGVTMEADAILVGSANNVTTPATLINNGTLNITNGGFLKIGNGASKDGQLTFGPSSVTATPSLYFNNGKWRSTATRSTQAKVTGGNIGPIAVDEPRQNIVIEFVSFLNTGTRYFPLADGVGDFTSQFTASNCVFVSGDLTVGSGFTPNSTVITTNNCRFMDLTGSRTITIRRANGGSAAYEFKSNRLKHTVDGVINVICNRALEPANG